MPLAVGDMNKAWNRASEIQQCMQIDSGLDESERSPGEHRDAKMDGRGVQCVDGVRKVDAEIFVAIERPCPGDRFLSEVGGDTPVQGLVGIG